LRRFIDDTVRDIFYALRTFRRAPLVAFTVVATVALGLGLTAANDQWRAAAFHPRAIRRTPS